MTERRIRWPWDKRFWQAIWTLDSLLVAICYTILTTSIIIYAHIWRNVSFVNAIEMASIGTLLIGILILLCMHNTSIQRSSIKLTEGVTLDQASQFLEQRFNRQKRRYERLRISVPTHILIITIHLLILTIIALIDLIINT